jgi:hypothetical protein
MFSIESSSSTFPKVNILVERWRKPNISNLPSVEVRGRNYYYEKCNEGDKFSYILHGRNGARYGLIGKENHFLPLNMKTKKIINNIGKFQFTENGLKFIPSFLNTKLVEGGAAASNLIKTLVDNGASPDIKYTKIDANDMGIIFKEIVKNLLLELEAAGFLDSNYKTEFMLGSTRLAAHIAGEKVKFLPSEDKGAIAKALTSKKTYGDLDIDIVLKDGKSLKEVGEYLSSKYPSKIAYKLSGSEANLAYVWDDKVIQIDLVNVGGSEKNKMEFTQSSSVVDISYGIKGIFQSILIRTILSVKELTLEEKDQIRDALSTNAEIKKWVSQGYDFKVPGVDDSRNIGRWQLGGEGIYLVVDLFKPGKKEGSVTKKTIKLSDDPVLDFSILDNIADAIIPGADIDTINSAVKTAQMFKSKYPQKVETLWKEFSKSMEFNKDGMDETDYNNGMNTIAKILGIKR